MARKLRTRDARRIGDLLTAWEGGRLNPADVEEPEAVGSAIPHYVGFAAEDISALNDVTPGSGLVDLYTIGSEGDLIEIGIQETAYNLGGAVADGDLVQLHREPVSGKLVIPASIPVGTFVGSRVTLNASIAGLAPVTSVTWTGETNLGGTGFWSTSAPKKVTIPEDGIYDVRLIIVVGVMSVSAGQNFVFYTTDGKIGHCDFYFEVARTIMGHVTGIAQVISEYEAGDSFEVQYNNYPGGPTGAVNVIGGGSELGLSQVQIQKVN